jgi:uncharacterized protein (DUF1778 family)
MPTETRKTDKRGRVRLPRGFENATVLIEQLSETEVIVRLARVLTEDLARLYEERVIVLSERDWANFTAALTRPPRPNEALRRLMQGHSSSDSE